MNGKWLLGLGAAVAAVVLMRRPASAGTLKVLDSQIMNSDDDGSIEWPSNVTSLQTCYVGNWQGPEDTWLMFRNIAIPRGARIQPNTYLELISSGLYPGSPATMVKTRLYFNRSGSPVLPVSPADYVGKPRTTAYRDFNPTDWVIDTAYQINVQAMIQELVSAFDYSQGGDMMAQHVDNGSTHPSQIMYYDFTENPGKVARLHIEYI